MTMRAGLAAIIIATALAGWGEPAAAHSWYEYDCCSDEDCKPVAAEELLETEKGWKHLPTGVEFTGPMIRPSRDRRFHVCIGVKTWNLGRPYCVYILQGT
jgi:hypothetical protein